MPLKNQLGYISTVSFTVHSWTIEWPWPL